MADSATEIDLDSVIDRLLEGGWRVPVSRSSFGVASEVGEGVQTPGLRPRWVVWKVVGRLGVGRRAVRKQHAAVSRCADLVETVLQGGIYVPRATPAHSHSGPCSGF